MNPKFLIILNAITHRTHGFQSSYDMMMITDWVDIKDKIADFMKVYIYF